MNNVHYPFIARLTSCCINANVSDEFRNIRKLYYKNKIKTMYKLT